MKRIGLLGKYIEHPHWLIQKSFLRRYVDHGNIVYDQFSSDPFFNKLEIFQYNAALAIMGAIKGTSREKVFQELSLEYLQQRRRIRHLSLLYKAVSTKLPAYIYNLIPAVRQSQRLLNTFNSFSCRIEYLKKSFFPCVIGQRNKVNLKFIVLVVVIYFQGHCQTLFHQVQVRFIISMMRSALN